VHWALVIRLTNAHQQTTSFFFLFFEKLLIPQPRKKFYVNPKFRDSVFFFWEAINSAATQEVLHQPEISWQCFYSLWPFRQKCFANFSTSPLRAMCPAYPSPSQYLTKSLIYLRLCNFLQLYVSYCHLNPNILHRQYPQQCIFHQQYTLESM
jgi:hypothetical protein